MRKKFARMVDLVREIAVFLVPVLTVVKLLIEIADKVANCSAYQLQPKIPHSRKMHFRPH
jgi:hypothetical protein